MRELKPPIDVTFLVKEKANLEVVEFPDDIDVDGLCIDLKHPRKKPTVYLNDRSSKYRKRFTLAHELGHIMIPWHIGAMIDEIDAAAKANDEYWEFEVEANRFASELLMPTPWMQHVVLTSPNPAEALRTVQNQAEVSLQAASIKLFRALPPDYCLAYSQNGIIQWSTRSEGTLIGVPPVGLALDAVGFHDVPMEEWGISTDNGAYKFWKFNQFQLNTTSVTIRPWRTTLDIIATELFNEEAVPKKFKASLNGVTSNANGLIRMQRTRERIITAIMHRLHTVAAVDARYRKFINHPLLDEFCQARAEAYLL